jgi:hypothetical protein
MSTSPAIGTSVPLAPDVRFAPYALVLGTVGSLVTMALHPTGPETLAAAAAGAGTQLARGVHLLAIAMQPLLVAGTLALTVRLREARALAVLAFVAFGLGTLAVLVAAAMSGLMAPDVVERVVAAEGATRETQRALLQYTGALNQAFAKIYVGMMSAAITGWSLAVLRERGFSRALGWLGLAIAAFEVLGLLSGRLHLDVRGFGVVVLAQSVWMLWAAMALHRAAPGGAHGTDRTP